MYGELVGEDLVFDPNPAWAVDPETALSSQLIGWNVGSEVNLEPEKGQIWARGLSLIAANTVAYAYQDASKLALALWTPLDVRQTDADRIQLASLVVG